jgi:hypothetical protein
VPDRPVGPLVRHVGGFVLDETWTLLLVSQRWIHNVRVQHTALLEVEFKTTAGEVSRRLWKVIAWPPRFERRDGRMFDEDTYSNPSYARRAARDGSRV